MMTPGEPPGQTYYWRKLANAGRGLDVPMFADCIWDGTAPTHLDTPPPKKGVQVSGDKGEMSNFCLPRHAGRRPSDMAFADASVRSVGLKELWSFRWSPQFDTSYMEKVNTWPPWMMPYQ